MVTYPSLRRRSRADAADSNLGVEVRVWVKIYSSRTQVQGIDKGLLTISIASPPEKGAANRAVVKLLANYFSVPRSAIRWIRGQRARAKTLRIVGIEASSLGPAVS